MRRRSASACSRTATPRSEERRRDPGRQHVLRHARGRLEVTPGGRARGADSARAVYVTGCASNLDGAFDGAATNVMVIPAERATTPRRSSPATSGRSAASQAEHRLDRVRAFVKIQDGCSFSCAFCVIPLVRGGPRSRTAAAVLAEIAGASTRVIARSCSPASTSAASATGRPATRSPRLVREAGAIAGARAPAALLDRGQPRRRRARRRADARRRPSRRTCTSRCSRATTACCARWVADTRPSSSSGELEPLAGLNLTGDVIVGFPAEDDAAFERTLALVERPA